MVESHLPLLDYEDYEADWDSDLLIRQVYLGTVFSIMPSGKYYMPWAFGNLTPCPKCNGTGISSQPVHLWDDCPYCKDSGKLGWRKLADIAAIRNEDLDVCHGNLLESGHEVIFVPTDDIMPGSSVSYVKCHCNRFLDNYPGKRGANDRRWVGGLIVRECANCGGHGFPEAYHDILANEVIESVMESIRYRTGRDVYIINGEGDPCDMFLAEYK